MTATPTETTPRPAQPKTVTITDPEDSVWIIEEAREDVAETVALVKVGDGFQLDSVLGDLLLKMRRTK